MKTELMVLLELGKLKKESKRLLGIEKGLVGDDDKMAMRVAKEINSQKIKVLDWVLDREQIIT